MIITIICHQGRAQKTAEYGFCLQEGIDNSVCRSGWRFQEVKADMYFCGFLPANHQLPLVLS